MRRVKGVPFSARPGWFQWQIFASFPRPPDPERRPARYIRICKSETAMKLTKILALALMLPALSGCAAAVGAGAAIAADEVAEDNGGNLF